MSYFNKYSHRCDSMECTVNKFVVQCVYILKSCTKLKKKNLSKLKLITQSDHIFIIHPFQPTCSFFFFYVIKGKRTTCGTQASNYIQVENSAPGPKRDTCIGVYCLAGGSMLSFILLAAVTMQRGSLEFETTMTG